MWRLTLARGVLFLLSAEYSSNVRGLAVNLSDLCLSMIYCGAMKLWSQICVMCRSCWIPDFVTMSCCAGARCLIPQGWVHRYGLVTEHLLTQI